MTPDTPIWAIPRSRKGTAIRFLTVQSAGMYLEFFNVPGQWRSPDLTRSFELFDDQARRLDVRIEFYEVKRCELISESARPEDIELVDSFRKTAETVD